MEKQRSPQEIQQEFTKVCAQVGDAHFKIATFKGAIAMLEDKMKSLNAEYVEATKDQEKPKDA